MKNRKINFIKLGIFLFGISLLMWNCENDLETIEPIQERIDFTLKPKIETFSLNQLNKDNQFNELKNSYHILQNKSLAKSIKGNSYSARLVDTLGITIDVNTIKKITYDNYVSYTMLMIEPNNKSNNFSNLVIQESNGIKRIFTVRYFPYQSKAKSSTYASKTVSKSSSTTSFNGNIVMRTGIVTEMIRPDDDYGGGGGSSGTGGCDVYETVCNTVNVWSSLCSCMGHFPEEYCTCTGPRIDFVQSSEECEDICIFDSYNNPPSGSDDGWTSGGTTNTVDNTIPTNVATTPVFLDGSSALATIIESINATYSTNSPFNVDMTDIIENIYLPQIDSISVDSTSTLLAAKKFNCIYRTLKNSDTFKNLFIDTFQDSDKFDVEFKLVPSLPNDANGNAGITGGQVNPITGEIANLQFVINMSIAKINSNSSFDVARTILHEAIHIYLKLKLKDCQAGTTLEYLNNLDLDATINEFYADFTCAGIQSQHDFMFSYMLPTFGQSLSEIMSDLVPLSHQVAAEANTITNSTLGINEPFDWDDFYYYFSMRGLDSSSSFISEIKDIPEEYSRFQNYNGIGNLFSKTSCPE